MTYLDYTVLRALSTDTFQNAPPFPWLNPSNVVTQSGFDALRTSMPPIELFTKTEGMTRSFGQKPHDRYELFNRPGLPISEAWRGFIAELSGPEYHNEMTRLFGSKEYTLRFQWQYAYSGSSVSPHCDSRKKLGSHLFYFNTTEDWDSSWGGRTLILDDEGRLSCDSAPALSEFRTTPVAIEVLNNHSLIFKRTDHSWHAVEEIHPPEGKLRYLFTVVFDKKQKPPTLVERFRSLF